MSFFSFPDCFKRDLPCKQGLISPAEGTGRGNNALNMNIFLLVKRYGDDFKF